MLNRELSHRSNLNDSIGEGGGGIVTVYANPIIARHRRNLGTPVGTTQVPPDPVLWTPSFISCAAWYSAKDSGDVILTSGLVSQWNDLSGNSRHATQSNASFRPNYTAGQSINFISTTFLDINFPQSSGQNIYAVVDTTNLNTSSRALMNRSAPSPPFPPAPYLGGTANYQPRFFWGTNWYPSSSITVQRLAIFRFYIESNQSTTAKALTDIDAQNLLEESLSGLFPLSSWVTINSQFDSQGSNMSIKELIVTTDVGVDKMYGYLAYEWGLTGILPTNHPYKNNPPYV